MGQTGLVAVDLVAYTCQEVVGAKKEVYLCTMRSKAGEVKIAKKRMRRR